MGLFDNLFFEIKTKLLEIGTLTVSALDDAPRAIKDGLDDLKDFGNDMKDDFKELGEIVVEGSADLIQTGVDLYLDYTCEKIDRFFENMDVLLMNDPYSEGKKQGYNNAAFYYEPIYKSTKESYIAIITSFFSSSSSLYTNG